MLNIPVPYDRLSFFLRELDITDDELDFLSLHRDKFISKKDEFGAYFYDYFYAIPRTKIIIDHDKPPRRLAKTLSKWFESLFKVRLDEEFLGFLWRSGIRHVDVNVDQRYVNLGYSAVRKFCQTIIESQVPVDSRQKIMVTVDKMLDFCVLVATDAYVTATTRCDLEVIKGVAHQVRNPITVIGGNIMRLQRKMESNDKDSQMLQSIISETRRLERMVTDISVYNEIFREDPRFTVSPLNEIISQTIEKLETEKGIEDVSVELDFHPEFSLVKADPRDLEVMFRYLLENSFEALDLNDPYLKVSSGGDSNERFVHVEIFNTGLPPDKKELDNIYTPFYSSKPTGTGFGLPIARMIARKNLGNVSIEPVPGRGTKCLIVLPKAEPT